jgi:hypothetical protein
VRIISIRISIIESDAVWWPRLVVALAVLESLVAAVTLRWAAAAIVVGLACGIRVCCQSHITKGQLYITKSVSIEAGMEAAEDVTAPSAGVADPLVQQIGPVTTIDSTNKEDSSPVKSNSTCWHPFNPCMYMS